MKAVVTGAAGLIGTHLCSHLRDADWDVCALARGPAAGVEGAGDLLSIPEDALRGHLRGADVVFHLAGRAHRSDGGRDARFVESYRSDNVLAMERVYRAACCVDVGRFVQLSTIKVLGDTSRGPLDADAAAAPPDVYSQSKYEAEQSLRRSSRAGIPVTVVRPPLVFGPGVRGNFARLIRLVERGWALPLGAADAPRSLSFVGNLCDLLERTSEDQAHFRILHTRDIDVDVANLVLLIGRALGVRVRSVAVPRSLMKIALLSTGNRAVYSSLFEPLLVEDAGTRKLFDWVPPVDFRDAIEATVAARTLR